MLKDYEDQDWGFDYEADGLDDAGFVREEAPIFEALAEAYGAPAFGLMLDWAEDARREEEERWVAGPF